MIGSAIRKPRIQPGRGSASADSMIDGRTMLRRGPASPRAATVRLTATSPRALVKA